MKLVNIKKAKGFSIKTIILHCILNFIKTNCQSFKKKLKFKINTRYKVFIDKSCLIIKIQGSTYK